MAKMIPDYIDQENSNLDGERRVFEWLSESSINGFVMHSLLQKNHRRKMIGEVDFLYISKRGILCIEVKGGQEIFREDGQWHSINKSGSKNEIKDPFRQSKDCMYAVKEYLMDTYGKYSSETSFLIGYSVIFPECKFTGKGNDLMTEIMFDCSRRLDEFPEYIEETFDFWQNQTEERHNYSPSPLTVAQINKLIDLFRGDFHVVPSMNLEIQHIEKKLIELTEEQLDALDLTCENKRVIINGGAGTGKSILAMEKARKMMAADKRVAYICFNRNMGLYVSNVFEEINEGSFIGTYHSLMMQHILTKCEYNISISEISKIFLSEENQKIKYDCIIVDEAQDLMNVDVIESLNSLLVGGLNDGNWVMFMDPNQNIFNNSEEYDFGLEFLIETYKPVNFTLNRNCRNTEQIGKKISLITSVPLVKHMKVTGPKVMMKTYNSKPQFLSRFRKEIMSYITGGTPVEDIIILSKYRLSNSMLSGKDEICGLSIVENPDITKLKKHVLNYYTIQSYKGLESKVVFLIDVEGFKSREDRILNYVGMSRAKIVLHIFFAEEKEDEYIDITT